MPLRKMLKSLEALQNGSITGRNFNYERRCNRLLNLKPAKHISFEEANNTIFGITTLDIDRVEDRYALCGSKSGHVFIYDLENTSGKLPYTCCVVGELSPCLRLSHAIMRVQWYPYDTGTFVSSSRNNYVKLWDTNRLEPLASAFFNHQVSSHDLSSYDSLIAVATSSPVVFVRDARLGPESSQELKGHKRSVTSVAFSPKYERILASGSLDGTILIWDVRSAKGPLTSLNQHHNESDTSTLPRLAHDSPVTYLKFTTDGLHLVSQSSDLKVKLWNADNFQNIIVNYCTPRQKERRPMSSSAWLFKSNFEICSDTSPPLLFVPKQLDICVFDLLNGTLKETIYGHFQKIDCLAYRSSTQELISGGKDLNFMAWSADGQKNVEEEYLTRATNSDYRQDAISQLSDLDNNSSSD